MFTKNFNSLPDSLIEASKKIMTESEKMSTLEPKKRNSPSSDHDDYDHEDDYERDEIERHQKIMDAEAEREERKKMSEASNEAPNIQRLTLTQEEISSINELMSVAEEALNEYVVNQAAHENFKKLGDAGNEAMKVAHNAPDRAIGALQGLHDRLSSAHPEHKVIRAHLASAIDSLKRAQNAPNDKERTQHIDIARDTHQKAHELLGAHLQHNAQLLSRQGVNINSEFVPEEVNEALSPEAKKRRDKLKADVRAAKDAYRQIKQAKSPKSGLAPLKTSVTPKEHESEDPEESARKHPIDRLRRIALSTGGAHFEFDNGEKHKISRDVARTIVKHYEVPSEKGGLKPYQKEKLQSDITKSHDHLMKHYNSISGTNEAKKLDEVPVETIKQVRTFNVEETDDETPPFEPDKNKVNWKGSPKSRAAWLAKHARDTMKKQMKTEQVKPGGDMAPNIHIPEGQIRFKKFSSPEAARQGLSGVVSGQTRTTKIGEPSKPQKMDAKPSSERKPLEDRLGEEPIDEREMTNAEMKKREKIVMKLKDKMAEFEKNYGKRAKKVMYATATKMAMKEETPKGKTMTGQTPDGIKENPPMSTKEGIGIKSTTT